MVSHVLQETECDERKKRAVRRDEKSSKRRDVTTTTRMTLQVFGGLSKANTIGNYYYLPSFRS